MELPLLIALLDTQHFEASLAEVSRRYMVELDITKRCNAGTRFKLGVEICL